MDQKTVDSLCKGIDNTVKELMLLNQTASGELERYLVQPVNPVVMLLSGLASALDKNSRIYNLENPDDFNYILGMVNRMFVNLIHSSMEAALDHLILQKKFDLKASYLDELKADIKKTSCVCGTNKDALNKLIKNAERNIKPNFKDKIQLVTECLEEDNKKFWRNYFLCLNIIRNKCSHADSKVNDNEITLLIENGFSNFINSDNIVAMNIKYYIDIYNRLLEFIRAVSQL